MRYRGMAGWGGEISSLLPAKYQGRMREFFAYGADFLPLTASLTQTQNINIESNSDFFILAAVATVTDTTNATMLGFVPQLVQLQNTGTGQLFFNQPTHFMNVFGTVENPGYFDQPRILDRSTTLSVQLQNLEATDRNVRVLFLGFKVYDIADQ